MTVQEAVPVKEGLWTIDPAGGIRLAGSRCADCGELFFPRKPAGPCTHCQGERLHDVALGPWGRIDSFSAVLQPPAGGFYRGPVPYCYGLVDLDEGLRVVSRLRGPHTGLARGMRVRLAVEDLHTDEHGRVVQAFCFEPAQEGA